MNRALSVCLVSSVLLGLPATGSGQPLPTAVPESVGVSSERLARLDALFESYVSDGRMAGVVVAVARRGHLVHFRSLGRMDRDEERPMRDDAIFRLASMSKPITTAAVLMLYEEGRFQLEDPVSWYIPELGGMKPAMLPEGAPEPREMRIHDLLTHMAGFPANRRDDAYEAIVRDPELTLQEMMSRLGKLPLAYAPGTEWRYSYGFIVLGHLVSVVSGTPFEEFLAERLFEPLGMVDSGFFVPESEAARVPSPYQVNGDGVTEEIGSGLAPEEAVPPKAPSGSGGLFATAHDYLRFAQMLLDGGELDGVRLLGRKTVELMRTAQLPPGVSIPETFGAPRYPLPGHGFGLGVRVRTDVGASQFPGSVGEYGWGGAHGTYFLIDPEEELVAAFFPQLRGSARHPIRRQFNNVVYQALVD